MPAKLHRKFIATVVSVAISITAFSAGSARAGDRDVARFLAGVAGLVVLGAIINDQRKKDTAPDYTARRDYQPLPHAHQTPRHALKPKPLPPRVARKVLPNYCLNDYDTRRGTVRLLGQHCLRKNYNHVNRLPRECYSEVRTRRGVRGGYGPQCLRTYGYTFARK